MSLAYYLNVVLHVLAALFWLGGMFFLGVVGAPVLRRVEPPALRQQLFHQLGARFRTAGWIAIGVLVVTGAANLHFRGLLRWSGALAEPGTARPAAGPSTKSCTADTAIITETATSVVASARPYALCHRAGSASAPDQH